MKTDTANIQEVAISPSDIGQSYVRIVVVTGLGIWAYVNELPKSAADIYSNPILSSHALYLAYCLLFLLVSYRMVSAPFRWGGWFHVKRVVGLFGDLISCGLYIFWAGEYGLAIYPVYVTIIVGYGLRYGFNYLFLAMTVALATFTAAAIYSPLFQEQRSLMGGFYLGLILIPGYAALLLKKYQDLLIRLSEVNAARARFIANMSHELRTPLHAIIGNAEVLGEKLRGLERADRNVSQLSTSVRMVSEASEHLRALVDGVLDIASSDAGTFVLGDPVECDLYRIIQSAVAITKPDGRRKDIDFKLYIDPDTPRLVETWEQLVRAVLINTIGNAVKYTNVGFISVLVHRLDSEEAGSDQNIRIRIVDTGIGISPSQLRMVYEPFMIGDDSRARSYEGTGLGLTITKQYLTEMGGIIDIQSEEMVGTTVTIEIPVRSVVAESTELPMGEIFIAIASPTLDPTGLTAWLEQHNVEVDTAEWTGTHLIADFPSQQPDFVLINSVETDEIESIAESVNTNFEGTLAVLVGPSTPDQIELPGNFITRIELENDHHLYNLQSLVDRTQSSRPESPVAGYSILVVDDNETNLQSAEIALQSYGHSVRTAIGGDEALRAMRQEDFDLVFMDMHMPEFSGIDVARAFAEEAVNPVPVVMLTADVTKSASVDADIPEIVGFLTKPIKPSGLQLAVERFVDRNRSQILSGKTDMQHPLMRTMRAGLFSKDNYIELHRSGVSQVSLDGLIGKFVDDSFNIIDELKSNAESGDLDELKRLLHKLRGSAGAMHVAGLVTIIEQYQDLSNEDLVAALHADIEILKRSITFVSGEIRRFIRELDQ